MTTKGPSKQNISKKDVAYLIDTVRSLEYRMGDVEVSLDPTRSRVGQLKAEIDRMKIAILQLSRQDRNFGADHAAKMRMSGTEYKLAMMERWADNLREVAADKNATLKQLLVAICNSYSLRDAPVSIALAIDHMKSRLEDDRKLEAEKNANAISKLVTNNVYDSDKEPPVEFDSPSKIKQSKKKSRVKQE